MKKRINLVYHYEADLTWQIFVNVCGLALTAYLWYRIWDLSDYNLNMTIGAVVAGYIGLAMLIIIVSCQKKSKLRAKLIFDEYGVIAEDYNGMTIRVRGYKIKRYPLQFVFGTCDLYLRSSQNEIIRIRNCSIKVVDYL